MLCGAKTKSPSNGGLAIPPIKISGPEPSLNPEGRYECVCIGHALTDFMGSGKLCFYLEVCKGPHAGVQLEVYFNIKLIGVAGGPNTFEARQKSRYLRLMRKFFEDVERCGKDLLSPDNLDGIKALVQVETVDTDSRRQPLASKDYYSKIANVKALIEKQKNLSGADLYLAACLFPSTPLYVEGKRAIFGWVCE